MPYLIVTSVENHTPPDKQADSEVRITLVFGSTTILDSTAINPGSPLTFNPAPIGPDGDSIQLFDSRVTVRSGRSIYSTPNIRPDIVPVLPGDSLPTQELNYDYYIEDRDYTIFGNYLVTYRVSPTNPLDPVPVYARQVFNLLIELGKDTIALFINLFAVIIAPFKGLFVRKDEQSKIK
jgi:hypothetical protein